ncbi:hypothetical protein [Enterococcus faecalis]|uniref:hypothetical protein n=1 Tax=Enterococcus faecalis TaxID=1351 RepID=UPI001891B733|nr:hypothetical protein [Enterococcus faecalis]QPB58613.1 hypothetical protein GFB65_00095 [Enterococcus faecalis]
MTVQGNLIPIVLASTVIATIITTGFNFYKAKKEFRLKRITEERANWRREIKDIADILSQTEDSQKIRLAMDRLKVRINVFGYLNSKKVEESYDEYSFYNDSYIWDSIKDFEKTGYFGEEQKNILLVKLSLLLKYDWEKSKKEVLGEKIIFKLIPWFIVYYSAIIFVLIYGLKFVIEKFFSNTENLLKQEGSSLYTLIFLFAPFFILMLSEVEILDSSQSKSKIIKYIKKIFNACSIIDVVVLVMLFPGMYLLSLIYLYGIKVSFDLFMLLLLSYIPTIAIFIWGFYDNVRKKSPRYVKFLNESLKI